MNTLLRAGALGCALLASTALTSPAIAADPPRFEEIDPNGVDLVSGRFVFTLVEGTIGSGDGAVSLVRSERADYGSLSQWDGSLTLLGGGTQMLVKHGARTVTFNLSGSTWVPQNADGATLTGSGGSYTFRRDDGIAVTYDVPAVSYGPCATGTDPTCSRPMSIALPNGTTFTADWTVGELCQGWDPELFECTAPVVKIRLGSVGSSTGYSFTRTYPSVPLTNSAWGTPTGATFTNSVSAPPSNPTVTYTTVSSNVQDITDTGGRTWRITRNGSGQITGVRRPGSSSDDVSVSYGTGGVVSSVTRDGVTTSYSRGVSGATATTTITNALSQQTVVVADLNLQRITSVTDAISHTTSFQYDSNARLTRATQHEGNYVSYNHDSRGNVIETRSVAKPSSSLADIVSTASYPSTCANVLTCNQPTSVTDARLNTTDFTYDGTHGGVLTVTSPAAAASGERPQTRYSYTLTNGEYRLTGVSACASGSAPSCVDTSSETRTVIGYDANANVTSIEQRSGNTSGVGALSATSAMTYDSFGNLLTVDGPLAGGADTARYRYNAARQVVGEIGPDPDGAGALKHRAVRMTYRTDGLPTRAEQGTVNSQSDSDWAAFASLEEVQRDYDANDRPTVQRLVSGSTTYALTQTSYDALGRVQCVAQRMNSAAFGSLPASACALGATGNQGEDRITRTTYNDIGGVMLVQTGYADGTVQTDEVIIAYTNNGLVEHVTDANGNRTTYEFDGHDRLAKTFFPSPSTPGTSSTTDYEQLTYETLVGGTRTSGLVVSRRLRDSNIIGFGFDNLGRLTSKNLPGSDPDVTYSYDLLGRTTDASQTGHAVSFTFDALGRPTGQIGPQGTVSSAFDSAGRRTRLTWPDGFFVDYVYNFAGDMTEVRENGATSGAGLLATFAYDDRGRRTAIARGGGSSTTTSYGYDPVSRLTQLSHNLSGTAYDVTLDFAHSPAGQISSVTRSNDTYAFSGLSNQNATDSHNGLNQVTQSGSTSLTHDARGNTSAIGSSAYGYDSENRLTSAPGGVTLSYDPLGRLFTTTSGYRFVYDGATMVGEYNSGGALVRRYVPGPGIDEPLVWYEGEGTTGRRFLHADERGTIVAATDSAGAIYNVNAYDEYGQPMSWNAGRFQYTGQAWLPEVGLYYYRARMYNPTLGRFMQTDPIGYEGGMNLYAYVSNDPANHVDPTGLCRIMGMVKTSVWPSGKSERRVLSLWKEGCDGDGGLTGRVSPRSVSESPTSDDGEDEGIFVNGHRIPQPQPDYEPPIASDLPPYVRLTSARRGRQDYCGGGGATWPPDSVLGGDIGPACRQHDRCYASSSSRLSCDQQLRRDIIEICANAHGSLSCYGIAQIYFWGVRIRGEEFYTGTGNPD